MTKKKKMLVILANDISTLSAFETDSNGKEIELEQKRLLEIYQTIENSEEKSK